MTVVFENKHLSAANLLHDVVAYAGFYDQAALQFNMVMGDTRRRVERNIYWVRPPPTHVVLNSDGARKVDSMRAGSGCLIRNHEGRWQTGCCRNIGACTPLQAELWGLLDGLELAWAGGFRDVIVQADCLVAVRIIQNLDETPNAQLCIVRRIQRLLEQAWRVTITHVYRDGNRCADFLASFALSLEDGYHPLQEPPAGVVGLLEEDAVGIGVVRRCCNNT
ncbi:hypothetical protein QN277_024096 [Acacia crassicarpa]|uniref:RNase H type-1 domain-containing protein n=1 Tax=Acacia crassicarpa TaxID=499986 RepID=A0AAE1JF03_9FABA|nr:hypothetical protein QN277_024096 [Acacia crassicarpa]